LSLGYGFFPVAIGQKSFSYQLLLWRKYLAEELPKRTILLKSLQMIEYKHPISDGLSKNRLEIGTQSNLLPVPRRYFRFTSEPIILSSVVM